MCVLRPEFSTGGPGHRVSLLAVAVVMEKHKYVKHRFTY